MSFPAKFRDEAINEGVATAKLRGKELAADDVRVIINAVLAIQSALSPKIVINETQPPPRVVVVRSPRGGGLRA